MVIPARMLFFTSSTAFVLFGYVVVLVALSNNGRCPSSAQDINTQSNRCLENYRAFEERHQLTGSHLFTSVDVEIIRTLCSDLRSSMRCLKSLRDRCSMVPATTHQKQQQQQHVGQIDAVIRPYLSVVELCDHQHLYEEYAMNQNCLHGQREVSEQCYRAFQSPSGRSSKSTEHIHLQQYCGHMVQLMTCVRSNFALSCGESAVILVEQLVKAAVNGSHRCRNGSSSNTHDSSTVVSQTQKSVGRVSSLRRSNSAQTFQMSFICRMSQLIVSLTLLSAFVVNAFGN